jgi:hypothetical protein
VITEGNLQGAQAEPEMIVRTGLPLRQMDKRGDNAPRKSMDAEMGAWR